MSTRLYPLLRLNYAKTTQLYFSIQFRLLVRYLSGFKQCSGKKSCAKLSDNFAEGRRKIGKPVSYQLPSCFLSSQQESLAHLPSLDKKRLVYSLFCGCLPAYLPMSVSEVCVASRNCLCSLSIPNCKYLEELPMIGPKLVFHTMQLRWKERLHSFQFVNFCHFFHKEVFYERAFIVEVCSSNRKHMPI